jgi:hypothetical protein
MNGKRIMLAAAAAGLVMVNIIAMGGSALGISPEGFVVYAVAQLCASAELFHAALTA